MTSKYQYVHCLWGQVHTNGACRKTAPSPAKAVVQESPSGSQQGIPFAEVTLDLAEAAAAPSPLEAVHVPLGFRICVRGALSYACALGFAPLLSLTVS